MVHFTINKRLKERVLQLKCCMINITRSKKRFITNEWTKYMVKMKEKIKWERLTKSSLLILFFQRWVSFAALVWSLYITCPTDSSIHCLLCCKLTFLLVVGEEGLVRVTISWMESRNLSRWSGLDIPISCWISVSDRAWNNTNHDQNFISHIWLEFWYVSVLEKPYAAKIELYLKINMLNMTHYHEKPYKILSKRSITKVSYRHYGSTLHICFTSCHIPGWHAYPQL